MYVSPNFKTKKALKEAVLAGKTVSLFQPNNIFNVTPPTEGKCAVEGPHYPEPHKWYAELTLKDGKIIRVS